MNKADENPCPRRASVVAGGRQTTNKSLSEVHAMLGGHKCYGEAKQGRRRGKGMEDCNFRDGLWKAST